MLGTDTGGGDSGDTGADGGNAGGGDNAGISGNGGQSGQGTPQWVAGLPTEYHGETTLHQVKDGGADQMVSVPVTLVKNYVENQRAIGGMVKIPGEDSPAEEKQRFYSKLGVPEKPTDYELKVPETAPEGFYPKEELDGFRSFAHSLGLTKNQTEKLFNWRAENDLKVYNEVTGEGQKTVDDWLNTMKKEWGQNYDENLLLANKAARWVGDGLLKALTDAGVAAHPDILRGFAKIGGVLGEDQLKGITGSAAGGGEKIYTKEELDVMVNSPKYRLPGPEGDVFRKEVEEGFQRLYKGDANTDLNPSRPRTRTTSA